MIKPNPSEATGSVFFGGKENEDDKAVLACKIRVTFLWIEDELET